MQELEDDYEQRLADRVRQLEEKADESRRAAREHAEEIRQVKSKYLTKILLWKHTLGRRRCRPWSFGNQGQVRAKIESWVRDQFALERGGRNS